MTTNHPKGSATILQFPQGGRDGLRATSEARLPAPNINLPFGAELMVDDAWYHAEAVRDARPTTGKPR